MSEGFLSRWSRLKRVGPEPASAPPEPAAEPELPPAELEARLAELPPLDAIGPETDVTRFLEKWVPKALRDAALRKAWTSDPRIAGFIEVADFQWDWNVPGGAPGCGPLEPGFDAAAHVERLFADAHAPFLKSAKDVDRDLASQTGTLPADAAAQRAPDEDELAPPPVGPDSLATVENAAVAPQDSADDPTCAVQHDKAELALEPRRRHGRALPQ